MIESDDISVEAKSELRQSYLVMHSDFAMRYKSAWCSNDAKRQHAVIWMTELVKNHVTSDEIDRAHRAITGDEKYNAFPPKLGEFISLCKAHRASRNSLAVSDIVLQFHRSMSVRYRRRWCDGTSQMEQALLAELQREIDEHNIGEDELSQCLRIIGGGGGYIDSPPSLPDIVELCKGNINLEMELVCSIAAGGRSNVQLSAAELFAMRHVRFRIGGYDLRTKSDANMKRAIYKYFREGLVEYRKTEPLGESVTRVPVLESAETAEVVGLAIDNILNSLS